MQLEVAADLGIETHRDPSIADLDEQKNRVASQPENATVCFFFYFLFLFFENFKKNVDISRQTHFLKDHFFGPKGRKMGEKSRDP